MPLDSIRPAPSEPLARLSVMKCGNDNNGLMEGAVDRDVVVSAALSAAHPYLRNPRSFASAILALPFYLMIWEQTPKGPI